MSYLSQHCCTRNDRDNGIGNFADAERPMTVVFPSVASDERDEFIIIAKSTISVSVSYDADPLGKYFLDLERKMLPKDESCTTAAVQHYLGELAGARGDTPAQPIIRDLLGRAVGRLHLLCSSLLHQSYPRLTRPPLNLQADELLSSVVERLLKSLEKVQPENVRQFFALANQHMRWELNDLARRLDSKSPDVELMEFSAVAPESSGSELSQNARNMLNAIDNLPDAEREVFGLVRIQGMTQSEAAEIVGVSLKTIQRRLNSSLLLLTEALSDQPGEQLSSDE